MFTKLQAICFLLALAGLASCESFLTIRVKNETAHPIQLNYSERVHTPVPYDPTMTPHEIDRLVYRMDLADTTYVTRKLMLVKNPEPDTPFATYGLGSYWEGEYLDRANRLRSSARKTLYGSLVTRMFGASLKSTSILIALI